MLEKLLITGANGTLGSILRERLIPIAKTMRLGARQGLCNAKAHEELVHCGLDDKKGLQALVDGCDGIVHMAGVPMETNWETIREANIDGVLNLYEAARKSRSKPRIVFASSNHISGFYKQSVKVSPLSPPRPDSLYGVSKVFGETIARLYYDKFGIETASIRIGSCFPEPSNHRMLSSWLSYDDLAGLITHVFSLPKLGCPVIYGVSNNSASWWDSHLGEELGWQPKDSADKFRDQLDSAVIHPAADHVNAIFQGGDFCAEPIYEK
ncbi:MAG: NAD-dependent epimerase/dehydratase family protein [Cognatishimia sp.]